MGVNQELTVLIRGEILENQEKDIRIGEQYYITEMELL